VFVRTTLTLDPDVARTLKAKIAAQGATLKQVVNDALRRGLSVEPKKPRKPFRVKPWSLQLRPGIDPYKMNQLADELETQAILATMKRAERRSKRG
jgi:hypothetical protein